MAKIYSFLSNHPVYTSIHRVFSYIGDVEVHEEKDILLRLPTTHIEKSKTGLSKDAINIVKSPLLSIESWKLLFNRYKAFIFEEYFEKRWFKDMYALAVLNLFKKYPFIALTKRTKNFLEKNGFKVFFIPPAIKPKFSNRKRQYILYVSRLVENKNPMLVIKIAERMPDENFVVVGKGPLKKEIIRASKKLKNLEYIEYIEDRKTLLSMYEKAKLLIHPAKKDPIGFVVVEALSRATPVLATTSTGASDYLPEEWRMKSFDVNKWVKKINDVRGDTLKARKVFKREHLNIEDKLFKEISERIKEFINQTG